MGVIRLELKRTSNEINTTVRVEFFKFLKLGNS